MGLLKQLGNCQRIVKNTTKCKHRLNFNCFKAKIYLYIMQVTWKSHFIPCANEKWPNQNINAINVVKKLIFNELNAMSDWLPVLVCVCVCVHG